MKQWQIKIVPREDSGHDYKHEEYESSLFTVRNVVTLWGLGWGWWPLILYVVVVSIWGR